MTQVLTGMQMLTGMSHDAGADWDVTDAHADRDVT